MAWNTDPKWNLGGRSKKAPIHAERHKASQKRRLFAGKLNIAYNRERHLQRLEAGKIHTRRLFHGKLESEMRKEQRIEKGDGAMGQLRAEYARHERGQFRGEIRDKRISRK